MKPSLADIVANKELEIAQRKHSHPLVDLQQSARSARGNFVAAITQKSVNLIAELKPKSPSAGVLRDSGQIDVSQITALYSRYAKAISVLTDEKYFGGSLSLLAEVAAQTTLPLLCKDFVIDTYQVYEARNAGAEAVLLIVKILNSEQLYALQTAIRALGMTAVIEVQTEDEMKTALSVAPEVILINNRDLSTFAIDLGTTERLAALAPPTIPIISASGIESAADVRRLLEVTHRFLVGSSIMKSDDIEAKLRELSEVQTSCAG